MAAGEVIWWVLKLTVVITEGTICKLQRPCCLKNCSPSVLFNIKSSCWNSEHVDFDTWGSEASFVWWLWSKARGSWKGALVSNLLHYTAPTGPWFQMLHWLRCVQPHENDVSPCLTVQAEGWQLKISNTFFFLLEREKLLVEKTSKTTFSWSLDHHCALSSPMVLQV